MTGGADNGAGLASAALALIGAPYRLHGRNPATGLDCIGLLDAALRACSKASRLPTGYRLRSRVVPEVSGLAGSHGFTSVAGPTAVGDVLLVRTGPCQLHLLIAADARRFVHAHAGLRRVVCDQVPETWPILHHWRLAREIEV